MIRSVLKLYRTVNDIPYRRMAEQINIAGDAYLRLEKGLPIDQRNFIKVLKWLFQDKKINKKLLREKL